MPRITVTARPAEQRGGDAPVLYDEYVVSEHLSTDHSAKQFIERIAWAISDAEELELQPYRRGKAHARTRSAFAR
jgi:hypothetical protein